MQLVLHGCGMRSSSMTDMWGPVAASNNVVLVIPQVRGCWDSFEGYTGEDYLNKDGIQMKFLAKIAEIVTEPISEKYEYA